ncbi:hypothetical protein GCM10025768_04660 [Microbacterium pseudoresistens]
MRNAGSATRAPRAGTARRRISRFRDRGTRRAYGADITRPPENDAISRRMRCSRREMLPFPARHAEARIG